MVGLAAKVPDSLASAESSVSPSKRSILGMRSADGSAASSPASWPPRWGGDMAFASSARLAAAAASLQCEYMKKPAMAVTTPTDILTVNSLLSPVRPKNTWSGARVSVGFRVRVRFGADN